VAPWVGSNLPRFQQELYMQRRVSHLSTQKYFLILEAITHMALNFLDRRYMF